MSNLAKAQSLSRVLKERIQMRLPSFVISESSDSQGSILLISQDSTPAAGEQVMAIRIKAQDTQFSDSIGNAQNSYSPMVIQVIEEASATAGVSLLTLANRMQLDCELARCGCKQERYQNANTVVPAVSQFAADGSVSTSTLRATISDLRWPLSGQ